MKTCARCKRRRYVKAFCQDKNRLDGLHPYCRDCTGTYAKLWRERNRERELHKSRLRNQLPKVKRQKRNTHLVKSYGITLSDYHRLRRQQQGLCLICQRYFGNKLVVDHDHNTLQVRGLLCSGCNSDIRLFENNPKMVRRVLRYLAA